MYLKPFVLNILMCGIFGVLNSPYSVELIDKSFLKGKKRGPETSKLTYLSDQTIFGFHRLAINGLDIISNQPIHQNKNHRLFETLDNRWHSFQTNRPAFFRRLP